MSKEQSIEYFNKMDEIFRFRFEEWKDDIFTTKIGIDNVIQKAFTKLFGSGFSEDYVPTEAQVASGNTQRKKIHTKMFNTERKQINKVRYTTHKLNKDCIKHYFEIIKFYYPNIKPFHEYDWDFDKNRKDNDTKIHELKQELLDALDNGV